MTSLVQSHPDPPPPPLVLETDLFLLHITQSFILSEISLYMIVDSFEIKPIWFGFDQISQK